MILYVDLFIIIFLGNNGRYIETSSKNNYHVGMYICADKLLIYNNIVLWINCSELFASVIRHCCDVNFTVVITILFIDDLFRLVAADFAGLTPNDSKKI